MAGEKYLTPAGYCCSSIGRFVFYACSTTFQQPATHDIAAGVRLGLDETQRLIETVSLRNTTLVTHKGIGTIRIWDGTRVLSARIAWIAKTR